MSFDPAKREANLAKHGIDLVDCYEIFAEPMLTREDIRESYGEERFVSLGLLQSEVVLLVWTERIDGPRLISCRKAEKHEREAYWRIYRRR